MEGINPLKKKSLALESAIKKAFSEAKIENFLEVIFSLIILKIE